MKSVLLILPYFGKFPLWFDAFLVSVQHNPTINWLISTDCELPKSYPENIQFYTVTLQELNTKVNTVVEANVPLTPRKFCDLKPAYGAVFYDYAKDYDFWGFCDMDIIWGDIRKFITDEVLENYDIISSRKEAISGHFNLFRNTPELLKLYREIPNYGFLFEQPQFMWFDEHKLSNYLYKNLSEYRIYWNKILLNQERGIDSHQEYHLDRWLWKNGTILNTKNQIEVMYLHFINWKKTIKTNQIKYTDNPDSFYVSYCSVHYNKHTTFQKTVNNFKNIFDGYYQKEKRRIFKKRWNKKINRIKNRFKV